jgi:dUTP pyrophosphatase
MIPVSYKRIREGVSRPVYHTEGSVGFDLAAAEDTTVYRNQISRIPTGLIVRTPPGYMLLLVPRSSTPSKHGLEMPHSVGIIDEDYCGDTDELLIQVTLRGGDHLKDPEPVTIKTGTRIAQGVFVPVQRAVFKEDTTSREARGGFGTTG